MQQKLETPTGNRSTRGLGSGLSLTLEAMPLTGDGSLLYRPVGASTAQGWLKKCTVLVRALKVRVVTDLLKGRYRERL